MRSKRSVWILLFFAAIAVAVFLTSRPSREEQTAAQFEADRTVLEELARQVAAEKSDAGISTPEGWRNVRLHDGECPSVEFSFGSSGFGSETTYWGVSYVPCAHTIYVRDFYGMGWETLKTDGETCIFFEPEGDNTCYVKKLDDCLYYYEMSF